MNSFSIRKSASMTDFLVQTLDFAAVCTGGWAAYYLRFGFDTQVVDIPSGERLLVVGVAFFAALFFGKMYRMWPGGSLAAMVGRVSLGWLITWTALIVLMALTKSAGMFSRIWVVSWLFLTLVSLWVARAMAFFAMAHMRRSGYHHKSVVLYGDSTMLDTVRGRIGKSNWSGFDIVGTVVPGDDQDIAALDTRLRPDEIWIALSMGDQSNLESVLQALQQSVANIRLLPDLRMYQILNHGMSVRVGIPMVDISASPMFGSRKVTKAALDYSVAAVALLLLSPVMLCIALAVKLSSKGPVLFHQKRNGWNGEEITVYKFRSMAMHAEEVGAVTQAKRVDPRVTRVGRFIRKTSLDELPQFFNVLQGRMSVVGPRPHALAHNNEYVQQIPRYALRHKVKPGITGWAQICGYRGETDTIDKMEGRVKHDLFYLENWSIWMDIKIIVMTPLATLENKNVF
ncbi:MAG: undecaprenyl-phosphate glucose phosphotransferase [Rhodoferax sp.]|jgi:putative colanic acid biosynthesis UDP-glucose lipid carrier transferase|nr:undecaprenyl-phosphate glucose phosphotransferase [Rhodoferax sp.]